MRRAGFEPAKLEAAGLRPAGIDHSPTDALNATYLSRTILAHDLSAD